MKFNKKFFDRYKYKVDRDSKGMYHSYLKHKLGFKWVPLYEYAKKLPLQMDEILNIERQFIGDHNDRFTINISKTEGSKTVDDAKEVLNAFIHCVNAIINKETEPEVGTLKEFIVIENI